MIVAASNIPGRKACNDTSPLAMEEDRTARAAKEAEETKAISRDHLMQCKNASAEAAQDAVEAEEASSLAKELQVALATELEEKSNALKEIWHHVQEGVQSKEQAAKLEATVDDINMKLTASKIQASKHAQDAAAKQLLYEEKVQLVVSAQTAMTATEKFAAEKNAAADTAKKERLVDARAEWRDQWRSLDLEQVKRACENQGLCTLGTIEELQDRLESSAVMIIVTSLVERVEILLVQLFDGEGLKSFLSRQIGAELLRELYVRLRFVHRSVVITDVHSRTTLNGLQDCFGRMFGPIELILVPHATNVGNASQSAGSALWSAICVFQSRISAELADQKGTLILDNHGIRFYVEEATVAMQQVKERLQSIEEISVDSAVILNLLQKLVEIDSEDAASNQTNDAVTQVVPSGDTALLDKSEPSTPAQPDESTTEPGVSGRNPKQEILDMLDHATGLVVQLSESMEARKRLRNQRWGLTESGHRVKERNLPGIETAIGKKLYNVVVACVRAGRMVVAGDLERNFLESELVEMLGLPSAKSAKNNHELANWLLPQAKRYWNDLADALAVKGKATTTLSGYKSAAWRKARSSVVAGSALGRSTPLKVLASTHVDSRHTSTITIDNYYSSGLDINSCLFSAPRRELAPRLDTSYVQSVR